MNYQEIGADAALVIQEVGAQSTIIHTPRTAYDPGSSSADAAGSQRTACVAVRIEYGFRERETGLIDERDAKLIVSAVNGRARIRKPEPRDVIEFVGQQYEVISVKPVSPAGVAVIYEVQAREL
jgi:hypothetical protein